MASVLNDDGLATLLVDLLTTHEEHDRANVFDIELLARRLLDVTAWLRTRPETSTSPIAYFGASTGAGAALWAAADARADIAAIVSRGGRPDLAAERLDRVRAPTLLIVGGRDETVLELNRQARARLRCESQLVVVPGATHLFEEPGSLETVAALATGWFLDHLVPPVRRGAVLRDHWHYLRHPNCCQPRGVFPRTIVVPLDGSEFAARAVPVASAIARQGHGRVLLMTTRWDGDVTAPSDYLARIASAAQ